MFGRSGAAVEFLADWQIGDALLRVIAQARQQLTLVSPYNKHWGHLKREVAAAQQRGVAVTIYYRADEPGPPAEYAGVTVIPVRMLHAKIYANESVTLVTTMNLLETSAMYSREVGLLLTDAKLRREVGDYVKALADGADAPEPAPAPAAHPAQRNGVPRTPATPATSRTATAIAEHIKASGFCIACGNPKDFDLNRPLCVPCYTKLGRNGTHQACHRCGEEHPTQVNEPLCPTCHDARQSAGV